MRSALKGLTRKWLLIISLCNEEYISVQQVQRNHMSLISMGIIRLNTCYLHVSWIYYDFYQLIIITALSVY